MVDLEDFLGGSASVEFRPVKDDGDTLDAIEPSSGGSNEKGHQLLVAFLLTVR